MAYTVVRIKTSVWRDPFKEVESDTSFDVENYQALDEYLSMMESRGWSVVSSNVVSASNGAMTYMVMTLHRPEPQVLG